MIQQQPSNLKQILRRMMGAEVLGHPLVWLAATVLVMLLAYGWIQSIKPTISLADAQDSADSLNGFEAATHWNPEIYKDIKTEDELGIAANDDDARADNYRGVIALENKLTPLLEKADVYFKAEIYAQPETENAWAYYQQVLAIEPTHALTLSRTQQIKSVLAEYAEQAIETKDYDSAENWLVQLDTIQPSDNLQDELRSRITAQISAEIEAHEAEQKEISRLDALKTALENAHNSFNTVPPEPRAAYSFYKEALELEANSKEAVDGINRIQIYHQDIATQAIGDRNFVLAIANINRLKEISGNARTVTKLQQNLKKAQSTVNANDLLVSNTSPTKPLAKTDTQSPLAAINTTLQPAPNSNESNGLALQRGIADYYAGNYTASFQRLLPLAQSGIARAQFRVGVMYFQGRTVEKDRNEAAKWIKNSLPTVLRAAQEGLSWAQSDLGTAYEMGIGLDKNLSRAAEWYAKASQQGYAGAQTNLGVLYGTGDGVNYDRQLAVYWLKKAAEQGDRVAADNLKVLNAR